MRPTDLTSFKRAVPTGKGRLSPAVGRGVLGGPGLAIAPLDHRDVPRVVQVPDLRYARLGRGRAVGAKRWGSRRVHRVDTPAGADRPGAVVRLAERCAWMPASYGPRLRPSSALVMSAWKSSATWSGTRAQRSPRRSTVTRSGPPSAVTPPP